MSVLRLWVKDRQTSRVSFHNLHSPTTQGLLSGPKKQVFFSSHYHTHQIKCISYKYIIIYTLYIILLVAVTKTKNVTAGTRYSDINKMKVPV